MSKNISDLPERFKGKSRQEALKAMQAEANQLNDRQSKSSISTEDARYLQDLKKVIFFFANKREPTGEKKEVVRVWRELSKLPD